MHRHPRAARFRRVAAAGATPPSGGVGSTETAGSSPVSPVAVAGRWLLYGGLIVLLGAAFVALVVFPIPPPPTVPLVLSGWVVAVAGSVVIMGVQMVDAGV